MERCVFVFDLMTLLLSIFASKRCYSSLDHRVCKRLVPFAKLDLCRIQNEHKDFVYNVTSVVHGHTHVHRYFSLNPFKPIQRDKRLEKSNCPKNSIICQISEIWTDCTFGNTEDACTLPTFTADSYGFSTKSVLYISEQAFKGATAVLNTSSGPCYYCRPDANQMVVPLQSSFFFFCDERIVGVGAPVLSLPPRQDKPTAVFIWKTSIACYQTRKKEYCLNSDWKAFCPFHCNTSVEHNIYSFPTKEQNLNLSIESEEGGKESYSFGFCNGFNNGNCNKDTIICKTFSKASGEGEQKTWVVSVISFKDKIKMIIRPNGYVWRVHDQRQSRKLIAVISFKCNKRRKDVFEDVVLDNKEKLVPWFSMSGHGFCAQASPTSMPSTTPSPTSPHLRLVAVAACIAMILLAIVAFIVFMVIRPPVPPGPHPEEPPDGQEPSSSSTAPHSSASSSLTYLTATLNSWMLSRYFRSEVSSPLTVFSEGNQGDTESSTATERDSLPKRLKKRNKPLRRLKQQYQEPSSSSTAPHSSASSSSTYLTATSNSSILSRFFRSPISSPLTFFSEGNPVGMATERDPLLPERYTPRRTDETRTAGYTTEQTGI